MTGSDAEDGKRLAQEGPSKSQLKREMAALQVMAGRLAEIPPSHLERIPYPEIREAIATAKGIGKGNARKRQLRFVAKQLSRVDLTPVRAVLDQLDASSAAHNRRFHQLERWREALVAGDGDALEEVAATHPGVDRQHLRQLVRNAVREREQGNGQAHYRKLFQYLKLLTQP